MPAALLIRSVLEMPVELASSRVPPVNTTLLVLARRAAVDPLLSMTSLPLVTVVGPLKVLAPVRTHVPAPVFVTPRDAPAVEFARVEAIVLLPVLLPVSVKVRLAAPKVSVLVASSVAGLLKVIFPAS